MKKTRFFIVILITMCLLTISIDTGSSKHFQDKFEFYGPTLACDLGFYY